MPTAKDTNGGWDIASRHPRVHRQAVYSKFAANKQRPQTTTDMMIAAANTVRGHPIPNGASWNVIGRNINMLLVDWSISQSIFEIKLKLITRAKRGLGGIWTNSSGHQTRRISNKSGCRQMAV